jgi:hypothetical protein
MQMSRDYRPSGLVQSNMNGVDTRILVHIGGLSMNLILA